MEIAFLILVISHALVGLRSILLDLNPSDLVLKGVDTLFVLVGSGSIAYGIWLVVTVAQK
jgi:succinate dehydrogenase hydrophobic anchor subunit